MSSWVSPSLAAELWGTTVDDILQRIIAGQLRTREEGGFLFIDANAPRLRPEERPTTYKEAAILALESESTLDSEGESPLNFRAVRARMQNVRVRPVAA